MRRHFDWVENEGLLIANHDGININARFVSSMRRTTTIMMVLYSLDSGLDIVFDFTWSFIHSFIRPFI